MDNPIQLHVVLSRYRIAKAECQRWQDIKMENFKILANLSYKEIVEVFDKIAAVKIIRDTRGVDLKSALEIYDSLKPKVQNER